MQTNNEYRSIAVAKYFTKTPNKPSYAVSFAILILGGVSLCLGLVGIIAGFSADYDFDRFLILLCCAAPFCFFAIVFFPVGGLAYWGEMTTFENSLQKAEPKPTDQQMDQWLKEDKQRIISGAMSKLDLIREQVLNPDDPLVIIGPQSPSRIAMGTDGIFRFSKYEIIIIYLTSYHLGAYTCDLDFYSGTVLMEQTQEYHYTDVVSVTTSNENSPFSVVTRDGYEHEIATHQQFTLSVANGDRIRVTVAFPQVSGILQSGKFLPTGAEKAISTLRTMLRDKKGGTQGHV